MRHCGGFLANKHAQLPKAFEAWGGSSKQEKIINEQQAHLFEVQHIVEKARRKVVRYGEPDSPDPYPTNQFHIVQQHARRARGREVVMHCSKRIDEPRRQ